MQTQTITSKNASVHVKVAYENEFRRFLLTPVTFEKLETMLKSLFSLDVEFRIKFQDDENDWVLLTTDQELVYATELSGSPLRLQVKLLETPTPGSSCGVKARGGKGCRGQRGGMVRGGMKTPLERLTWKTSCLTERITQLETKLKSDDLTEDREKFLRSRLALVTKKLDFVKQKLNELETATVESSPELVAVPVAAPVPAETGPEEDEQKPWRGRRGFGRGRGGCRRAMMSDECGPDRPGFKCGRKPRIAPELIANFRQCKADLRAARESGDSEKIKACLEAFHAAKDAKMEARDALKSESL